jgi:hypothetical protein
MTSAARNRGQGTSKARFRSLPAARGRAERETETVGGGASGDTAGAADSDQLHAFRLLHRRNERAVGEESRAQNAHVHGGCLLRLGRGRCNADAARRLRLRAVLQHHAEERLASARSQRDGVTGEMPPSRRRCSMQLLTFDRNARRVQPVLTSWRTGCVETLPLVNKCVHFGTWHSKSARKRALAHAKKRLLVAGREIAVHS